MREFLVLSMYGIVAMFGLVLSTFWAYTTVKRFRYLPKGMRRTDRYLQISLACSLVTAGDMLEYTGRVLGNLKVGISPLLLSFAFYPIMGGLMIGVCGGIVLVRLMDAETDPPRHWLKLMGVLSILWTVIVYYYEFY